MSDLPEQFLTNFLISLRNGLKSRAMTREEVLWSLTTAQLTIEAAIVGVIEEGDQTLDVPDGWPPDEC